jgi:hypothetical protein
VGAIVTLTSEKRALEGTEVSTTAIAFAISTALYMAYGHAYLSRGVVGDLAGFALLSGVVAVRHRRLRHEALVCLAAIGVVLLVDPQWPLSRSSGFWWWVVTAGLAGYLTVRQRLLPRSPL